MPNVVCINLSGRSIPVYEKPTTSSKQIGEIYNGELYIRMGFQLISFYSPKGPAVGYIANYGIPASMIPAFSPEYAQAEMLVYGYIFPVRRKCRIFWNGKEISSIYPGDVIGVDGNSYADAGTEWWRPYRLKIFGYRKNGEWLTNVHGELTCDTDIDIGYSMAWQITPYSSKWY